MEPFTVVVADAEGVVRSWDTEAESLFGHPANKIVGSALDVIIPEAYREAHWTAFRALMSGATADEPSDRGAVILPVQCHDGSLRPTGVRLMLLRDPWGRPVGAAAVFTSPDVAPEGAEPLPEL
ncbi:PAS domain-containing protein [Frankia sp. CiP3]|uniref:PAS domain-containing protein n=1 Tax=Frankia sp. CiP3 TaxID=2880971 RepID=UPI001EF70564|nr:PAS domain-containing protein [Frankia sp. CiP3]